MLKANLKALSERDAELSQSIEATMIPEDVQLAIARDGSVSFRLDLGEGRRYWLGHSSVPMIAARANVKRIKPGKANLVMGGIGSGVEAQMLLAKMPPYQALVVVEKELLHLNLVLRLRDVGQYLANGRLVLLAGDEAENSLEDFYRAHSGYNLIDQTIAWPWQGLRANHAFAQEVTRAMQHCGQMITDKINNLLTEQQKHDEQSGRIPEKIEELRVINCTSSYTPIDVYTSRDCLAGLAAPGATVDHQVLDRADMVSPAAQLERINKQRPHLIVLIDMLRGDLKLPLPASAMCVSILRQPRAEMFQSESTARLGKSDLICPSLKEQAGQLKEAGFPAERIIHLPLAVNTQIYVPVPLSPEDERCFGSEVAIISARCSIDPEDYEIRLPTHQQLWGQVAEDIRNAPERYHYDAAGSFLRRAQRCGVELKEQDLRQYFTGLIQNYLGETMQRDIYAEALAREKIDLSIWSWSREPQALLRDEAPDWSQSEAGNLAAGTISDGEDLNKLFNAVKIVVHISSTGLVEPYILEGIAAGAFFLVKSHPRDRKEDGIAEFFELGKEIITFDTPKDLICKVRYYLEHEQERMVIIEKAREKLLDQHSYEKRMGELRERIGKKQM